MMTKCEKCDTWMTHEGPLCSACTDTMGQMRAKVAEHKDPDYLLAKAAFTVLHDLNPRITDPARIRAEKLQEQVYHRNWPKWVEAWNSVFNRQPRRRWQDKENA